MWPGTAATTPSMPELSSSSGHIIGAEFITLYREIDQFLTQMSCKHAYLDMGTNIGVQIRKLFEPHKYASAEVLPVFDEVFGPIADRCANTCAIGFEPNPTHKERLDELQQKLRAAGASVLVLRVAVGEEDGAIQFGTGAANLGRGGRWFYEDIAASKYAKHPDKWVSVPKLDVSKLVQHVRQGLGASHEGHRILMKLDIEGAELEAVPRLLASSNFTICDLDRAFIEWHEDNHLLDLSQSQRSELAALHNTTLGDARRNALGCRQVPTLTNMDDESFLFDGQAWPTGSVCPGVSNA